MVHLQNNSQHFGTGNCSKLLNRGSLATDHFPSRHPPPDSLWNAGPPEPLLSDFLGDCAGRTVPCDLVGDIWGLKRERQSEEGNTTEFFTIEGNKIREVEVYFGAAPKEPA